MTRPNAPPPLPASGPHRGSDPLLPALGALWILILGLAGTVPWIPFTLTAVGLVSGWRVLQRGLEPCALHLRASDETLPSLAASGAFLLSLLLLVLWGLGRLPPEFRRSGGAPVHYLDIAILAIGAQLAAARLRRVPGGPSRALALGASAALVAAAGAGTLWHALGASTHRGVEAVLAILLVTDPLLLAGLRGGAALRARRDLEDQGVVLRDGLPLERLRRIRAVAFRRTGVLTRGQPRVHEVVVLDPNRRREDVLRLAAAAEFGVQHPLRDGLFDADDLRRGTIPNVKGFEYLPGRGVRALLQGKELCCGNPRLLEEDGRDGTSRAEALEAARPLVERGDSVLYVTLEGRPLGLIAFRDALRPEAHRALQELRDLGVRCLVVSGDEPAAVEALERELGPLEAIAGLPPAQAAAALVERSESGETVAAVAPRHGGSGLLEAGDVSVEWPGPESAPSSREAGNGTPADIGLVEEDLGVLPRLIRRARRLQRERRRRVASCCVWQALAWPLVAGATAPWGGLPPSPELAALLLLAGRAVAARRPSPAPGRPPSRGTAPAAPRSAERRDGTPANAASRTAETGDAGEDEEAPLRLEPPKSG